MPQTVATPGGSFSLAPSTLNKMRVFGTGPSFYRLGRAIRYRRGELDDWRDRFRAVSTTEANATLPHSLTTRSTKSGQEVMAIPALRAFSGASRHRIARRTSDTQITEAADAPKVRGVCGRSPCRARNRRGGGRLFA